MPGQTVFTMAEVMELNGMSRGDMGFVQLVMSYRGSGSSAGMDFDQARIQAAWDLFSNTRLTSQIPASVPTVEGFELSLIFGSLSGDMAIGLVATGMVYITGGNPWSGPFVFVDGHALGAFMDLYREWAYGSGA